LGEREKGRKGEKEKGRNEECVIDSLYIVLFHIHEDYQKAKTELAMVFDKCCWTEYCIFLHADHFYLYQPTIEL
jgi:hypothetical protein